MHASPAEVLYARSTHGSIPVRVVTPGRPPGIAGVFELLGPLGDVTARYGSARSLLRALTGNKNHGLTFDRYFGIDDPSWYLPEGGSVLDLFVPQPQVVVESKKLTVAPSVASKARSVPKREAVTVLPGGLGIDLAVRGHEVRKILFAGFGARIMRSGYDPDEVLQEVYRGILARNIGKCPFDVKRSSFGHYCHMVIECVLNNYHRRETRRRQVEQVGLTAPASLREGAESNGGSVDAAQVAETSLLTTDMPDEGGMPAAVYRLMAHLDEKRAQGADVDPLAGVVVRLLGEGMNKREIAKEVGVKQSRVLQVLASVQQHVGGWL